MGTAEDPVIFGDHHELLLCYEIAPAAGGGNAILAFKDAVHYEQNPWNVPEGLGEAKYPFRMWDFTEVVGSDRTAQWSRTNWPRRFWTISFNDVMFEIVFSKVEMVHQSRDATSQRDALVKYLLDAKKLRRDVPSE
ncbi:MAG: hypothetical protein EOO15_12250 [Chitinophagaceae bacterium]|nr:MAG: hypothetical protein EOO15_12250 [Chitinophagaceae bacterium]